MASLLQSTLNTRALPTGDLRYIRSDVPAALTDVEVQWLLEHQVTTVVDLREEAEWAKKPCRLEQEDGFAYYHMPVTGGGDVPKTPEDVPDSYLDMLDAQMDRIVDTIMQAPENALYFCSAGKDRTGVVSAVIMKKLGFSNEEIIADYMQTKENLMDFLLQLFESHPEINREVVIPRPENLSKVLAALEGDKV